MSLLLINKIAMPRSIDRIVPKYSHLKQVEDVVNGVIVYRQEFEVLDASQDARKDIHYTDMCLGNLQKLGQIDSLRTVVMQRNDVDLVVESLSRLQNEQTQVSAQNN